MRNSHDDGAGLRPGLGVAAAALMLLPFAAGPAQAHLLYDTTRIVAQEGSCFTVWPQGQTFDADLNMLVTNWCDKPEALNVTLGCMPGN